VNTQETLRRMDPLRRNIELSLTGTYYPAGFRLDLATNSPDVLEAASEAWENDRPAFVSDPIIFRILVQPEGGLAPAPTHRMHGHLYSLVADSCNFAQLDLKAQFGFFNVSEQTVADHSWLRWFFLESMAYVMLAQRYLVPIHAACIARNGTGLLLSGPSGAGKSTLSYACARAGWAFVTDDCTWLLPDSVDRTVIGRPRQARFRLDAPSLFPELEGYAVRARPNGKIGIEVPLANLHIQTAPSASVGGIVFLERGPGRFCLDRLSPADAIERILDDMATYGEEVDALHERTVRGLAPVPAWRMRYDTLEQAVRMLESLEI
jgi:hypothetical protein